MPLFGAAQEVENVVVAESAVAALADPEERELAAIAQPLDGVHVQVQHLGDLGRGEKLPNLVRHHRWYLVPRIRALSTRRLAPGGCGGCGSWSDSKVVVLSAHPVRSVMPRSTSVDATR